MADVTVINCSLTDRYKEVAKIGPCWVIPIASKMFDYFPHGSGGGWGERMVDELFLNASFENEVFMVVCVTNMGTYDRYSGAGGHQTRVDASLHLLSESDAIAAKLMLEAKNHDDGRGKTTTY